MRRLLLRPLKRQPPSHSVRAFTHNSTILNSSRPQLPFLSTPHARFRRQQQQWRYLTTERKAWFRWQIGLGLKWTAYVWAIALCYVGADFAIQQESLERRFPTPHEWSFRTRMLTRGAEAENARTDVVMENWPRIIGYLRAALDRLEDPSSSDGNGLRDLGPEKPPGAKDISAMPEAWRRGYYEALLLLCRASEHVDGWVVDITTNTVWDPDMVRGPSNPNPKPIPPHSKPPPKEKDCKPAGFPQPDALYLKLLATEGLTTRQRMDAALAYANWLEYKGFLGPAAVMYEDALSMAATETGGDDVAPSAHLDLQTTAVQLLNARPTANVLASLTALVTFKARHDDVAAALPVLITILQTRRNLPFKRDHHPAAAAASRPDESGQPSWDPVRSVLSLLAPPAYPPPPDDGTAPPVRDSRELCEEAALHLHIGEIMYTSAKRSSKEDGLAWTREGVDLAEEELHKVLERNRADEVRGGAKKTCRECLASGLGNWATMVRRMRAREEEEARAAGEKNKASSAGWFGLWSGSKELAGEENVGRWAAEEKVVGERTRRAQDMLEDLQKPKSAWLSGLVMA